AAAGWAAAHERNSAKRAVNARMKTSEKTPGAPAPSRDPIRRNGPSASDSGPFPGAFDESGAAGTHFVQVIVHGVFLVILLVRLLGPVEIPGRLDGGDYRLIEFA